MYILIDRLLEVKEFLNKVLFDLQWDNIRMESFGVHQDVTQAYAVATLLTSRDTYVTLSDVIPYYCGLRQQLEYITKDDYFACVKTVAEVLLAELNKRFRCLVGPDDSKHNVICAIATLLHPSLKVYVTSNEGLLKSTREKIVAFIKHDCGE